MSLVRAEPICRRRQSCFLRTRIVVWSLLYERKLPLAVSFQQKLQRNPGGKPRDHVGFNDLREATRREAHRIEDGEL